MDAEGPDVLPAPADGRRARILIAAAAAVVLIAIVVVVSVASGGDEETAVAAAPLRCVNAWNNDPAARAYGRHNFDFHHYEGALVTFLDDAALDAGPEQGGRCAVVFPSEALDPEPFAAGQVLRRAGWIPISSLDGVELTRLAELQVQAAGGPNTTLDEEGVLTSLDQRPAPGDTVDAPFD